MKKIRVSIEGDGRVTIKLKKRPVVETRETGRTLAAAGGDLLLSSSLINQMEIRVESVFRPGQSDVEIAYALSGSTYPDMLHKFSSNEVVAHATQDRIITAAEKMAEHILRERPDAPNIIVGVHTHPDGAAELSEQDKSSMLRIAAKLKEHIAGANVVFGVHAVSRESPRARAQPVKIAANRIKWSSITRTHEVAFFNENAEPVGVSI
jgi:proteasome lid subunit RPN8/RPN11